MDDVRASTGPMRQLHDAIFGCQNVIVLMHDIALKHRQAARATTSVVEAGTLYQEYLVPLWHGITSFGRADFQPLQERMTTARMELGLGPLSIRGVFAPCAHLLVWGISIYLLRSWNELARPESEVEPTLLPTAKQLQIVLWPPKDELVVEQFLNEVRRFFENDNPMKLTTELQNEYAKAVKITPDDEFQELRNFAAGRLKGDQRKVVETICDCNGSCPLPDLAIVLSWNCQESGPKFNDVKKAIQPKLQASGLAWRLRRQDNRAEVFRISDK